MVSWLHSFGLQWKHLSAEFDTDDAVAFQTRTHAVNGSSNPIEALSTLLMEASEKPGVFLVAEAEAKKGRSSVKPTFRVVPFHHPKVDSVGKRVIGLASVEGGAPMEELDLQALTEGLVSNKKATSKAWKNKWVPSLEKLVRGGEHPNTKPTNQDEGDSVFSIHDLVVWPRLTFIPVQLLPMMFDKMETRDNDDLDDTDDDEEEDPAKLLEKLIQGMRVVQEKQPHVYQEIESMATYPAAFLWAISNRLNEGVELLPAGSDRETIEHGIKCNQELLFNEQEWHVLGKGKQRAHEQGGLDEESERPPRLAVITERESAHGVGCIHEEQEDSEDESEGPRLVEGVGYDPNKKRPASKPRPWSRNELLWTGKLDDEEPSQPTGVSRKPGPPRDPDWSEGFVRGFTAANQALTDASKSLNHLAHTSQATLAKKESNENATSKWLPSWVYLIRALSTDQGWHTLGYPSTTDAFEQLNETKLFQATMLVRSAARQQKWPGGMLKSGVADFLKRGFLADDIDLEPSGFSVLFFYGGSYVEKDGEAFSRQQLRESYGDAGLSDEMLRAFNKREIFIPRNTYEAVDQIQTAIAFLNWICGEDNIAAAGYKVGLKILRENKRVFDAELVRNKSFLINFLYMLDRTFQDFCLRMLDFQMDVSPAQSAKERGMHKIMESNIIEAMRPWMVNRIVPNFSAPINLQGKSVTEGVVDLHGSVTTTAAGNSHGRKGESRTKTAVKENDANKPELGAWVSSLPLNEYVKEWQLPQGKNFSDYFGPDHQGSTAGIPKFKHHRTGRMERLCLRFQLANCRCVKGNYCRLSHVLPSEMPRKDKDIISSHLQELFKKRQD